MMKILELLMNKAEMTKIMLTVFKHNKVSDNLRGSVRSVHGHETESAG